MEPIGLKEAIEIIEQGGDDLENLVDDPRLSDFINRVENASMEVLENQEDGYLLGAIAFLQACVISGMVATSGGDVTKIRNALRLISSNEFAKAVTICFKMSVGLCVTEELR